MSDGENKRRAAEPSLVDAEASKDGCGRGAGARVRGPDACAAGAQPGKGRGGCAGGSQGSAMGGSATGVRATACRRSGGTECCTRGGLGAAKRRQGASGGGASAADHSEPGAAVGAGVGVLGCGLSQRDDAQAGPGAFSG